MKSLAHILCVCLALALAWAHISSDSCFAAHHFIRKDGSSDALTADTIEHAFKEVHSEVDAVFTYNDHLYIIKDDQVYLYKSGDVHVLLEGYPKPLTEELGIEGPIDAAFFCESHAHIIKDGHIYNVDMAATPRVLGNKNLLPLFKKVDAAMCDATGVKLIIGNHFYHYASVHELVASRTLLMQYKVSLELFGCDH